MGGTFKINSALFICFAFIFRILFVNVSLLSTLTSKNQELVKSHFSSHIKKRKQVAVTEKSANSGYVLAEICEEDLNEENGLKSQSLLLLSLVLSFFSDHLARGLNKLLSFHKHFSFNSAPRYLAFKVFRI